MMLLAGGVRRRSFVLIAVLVITTSALLVATSLLFIIDANLAGSRYGRDQIQIRLLAWSGVQAVASRLDEQRDRILDGTLPDLDEEYVIYETDEVVGSVRLLPVTSAHDLLAPEAGRLDLNRVDADGLAATGLVEDDIARAIIRHRDEALGGAFQSVAELLDVPGLDVETLYGPLEDIDVGDDAAGVDRDLGERVADRLSGESPRGLADIVTVCGVEPAIQRSGVRRINLNRQWSEELGRRVDERFGEGSGAALRRIMQNGTTFDDEGRIIQVLRFFNVDAQEWPEMVDALTTQDGDYHFGRLDINSATAEALVALPGIGVEEAAQIVRVRDGLSTEDRATIVWPVLEDIIPGEAYDELAGRLTTRSWTYRVRLAVSERPANADDDADSAAPMIIEAVIDLCDPSPRIAYLREVSHLQTAAILARHASFGRDDPGVAVDEDDAAPRSAEDPSRRAGDFGSTASLEDARGGSFDQGRSSEQNRLPEGVYDDETVDQEDSRPVGSPPRSDGAVSALPDSRAGAGGREDSGVDPGASRSGTSGQRRIGRWRTGR